MKRTLLSILSLLLFVLPALAQALPPPILNYEGVLLDNTGAPENGDRDMEFYFFDDPLPGAPENEILVDSHTLVGTGPVTVLNGMFNARLGDGKITDGAGPDPTDGPYLDLSRVFRDHAEVYLEVRVRVGPAGGSGAIETLLPRTRIVAAAYALNSHRLGGLSGAQFLRSDIADTKFARLEMDTGGATNTTLDEDGVQRNSALPQTFDIFNFGGGSMSLRVQGNPAWTSGNDGAGSGLDADFLDGLNSANFLDTSAAAQVKAGGLAVSTLNLSGNFLSFGAGATVLSTPSVVTMTAGEADTDDLFLSAGNNLADGGLAIFGDADTELFAGNGIFSFRNGDTGTETAVLDPDGNLALDGYLDVLGDAIGFGSGGLLLGVPTGLEIRGDAAAFTDSLILKAGQFSSFGELRIAGGANITLTSADGTFSFVNPNPSGIYPTTLLLENGISISSSHNGAGRLAFDGIDMNMFLGEDPLDDVWVPGGLNVSGIKAFVQNHPYRHDLSVVYNALEGDEAGTYNRGSARLVDGVARVPLGETFAWVTSPDIGLTAQVTPRGGPASLYVESVSTTELVVRSGNPDSDDAGFDYIVNGLRIGYEQSRVVREKVMQSAVPSDASYERDHARAPELRRYSPMERFQKMEIELHGAPIASFNASAELRRAIGEHDPGGESRGRMPAPADRGTQTAQAPASTAGTAEAPTLTPVAARPDVARVVTFVPVSEAVELGDILVADRETPGMMRLGRMNGDRGVVGIVLEMPDTEVGPPQAPIAFSGIVPCRVDAGYGAIEVGDLLTTSPTPGHAMRADAPAAGTIVGKALEGLDAGTGLIQVLVMLR